MSSTSPIENRPDLPVSKQLAELLRRNELLTEEIQQLRAANSELVTQLDCAKVGNHVERDYRRAALNLMEDADHARMQSSAVNKELQDRIAERLQAEKALDESQVHLEFARNNLRQLNAEFETRVNLRTEELRDREIRLSELAVAMKRTEQKERESLARLLHDQIQQLLIAAKMRADLLLGDLDGEQYQTQMAVISILGDAIDTVRNLSVQLSPPLLHNEGLPAALAWLASRMQEQHGITIQTRIDDVANPVSEEERDILFQAAQEFLLNGAKHAQVKQMQVSLIRSARQIRLQVSDCGCGFDPAKAEKSHGSFGLLQIRQRLRSVAGQLEISSANGKGTTVTAIVPIASEGEIVPFENNGQACPTIV